MVLKNMQLNKGTCWMYDRFWAVFVSLGFFWGCMYKLL